MKTTGYVAALICAFLATTPLIAKPLDTKTSTPPKQISTLPAKQKQINLNTATPEQLTHVFRGIGPKRAETIVAYRQQHGRFKSVTELAEIKGIGQAFVAKNLSDLQRIFVLE